MPELPEVDAARESIREHFAGQRVVRVEAFQDDKVMEGTDAAEIEQVLGGRRLVAPRRKGKHLWFEMEGDLPMPLFHLGMAGAFEIRGASVVKYKRAREAGDTWPPKWCKVAMEFEGGGALAFVDSRRFGRIRVAKQPHAEPPISELGWDALTELPEPKAFATLVQSSQRVVKAVLLDQAVLSGIGNWIADEVLFQARVHPESRAKALSEDDLNRLHKAINHVLSVAVSVRADCSLFPPDWLFHVRWNKVPGSILGHRITFITSGGRTSAVVPALQGTPRVAPRKGAKDPPQPGADDSDAGDTDSKPAAKSKTQRARKGAAKEEAPPQPGADASNANGADPKPPAKSKRKRPRKGAAEEEGADGPPEEGPDAANGAVEPKPPAKSGKKGARKGAAEGEDHGSKDSKTPRKRGRASGASAKAEEAVTSAEKAVTSAAASGKRKAGGVARRAASSPPLRRSARGSPKPAAPKAKSQATSLNGTTPSGSEKGRGRRKRKS